jgi:hypothetical protein
VLKIYSNTLKVKYKDNYSKIIEALKKSSNLKFIFKANGSSYNFKVSAIGFTKIFNKYHPYYKPLITQVTNATVDEIDLEPDFWNEGVIYFTGEVVRYNDLLYTASQLVHDNEPHPEENDKWIQVQPSEL